MSEVTPPLSNGYVVDGRFRVIRHLGRGGMGDVYAIVHEVTQHERALKLLRPELKLNPGTVRRFMREASAAGRIGNEHIAETFDAGFLSSGEPYLVMELLRGISLDEWLDQPVLPSLSETLDVIEQAARGVHAAHEAGIIHRDLKPENLFIERREERPFVKLLDFGISKFVDLHTTAATQTGALLGTPHYMSPEQFIDGAQVDARTDVYALGLVLYECLTGNHPYPSDSLPKLAMKLATGVVTPPSDVQPMLPKEVDAIVGRALEKSQDERFPTALAFADAVARVRRSLTEDDLLVRPSLDFEVDVNGPTVDSRVPPRSSVPTVSRDIDLEPATPDGSVDEPMPSLSVARPRIEEETAPATSRSEAAPLPELPVQTPRWIWLAGGVTLLGVLWLGVLSNGSSPIETTKAPPSSSPAVLAHAMPEPSGSVSQPPSSASTPAPTSPPSTPPVRPVPPWTAGTRAPASADTPSTPLTNTPIPADDAFDP